MPTLLPRTALAAHLETVELTQGLFPGDDELVLSDRTASFLPTLRDWIEAGADEDNDPITQYDAPDELGLTIQLALDQQDAETAYALPLVVRLPLLVLPQTSAPDPALVLPDGAPLAQIHAVQPSWMSRTSHDQLVGALSALTSGPGSADFASNVDLLLATIDQIRSMTPALLPAPTEAPPPPSKPARGKRRRPPTGVDEPEYRVWFWFPSLSTREKRDDMVNWAPEYNLTGFVLAGGSSLALSNRPLSLAIQKANSRSSRRQTGAPMRRGNREQRPSLLERYQSQQLGEHPRALLSLLS